jgi:hypothetical protein
LDDNDYAIFRSFCPKTNIKRKTVFYSDYPALFEVGENWIEHESTYGKRNQSGGEIEYTLYYTYADDMTAVKDEFIKNIPNKKIFRQAATMSAGQTETMKSISTFPRITAEFM